MSVANAEFARAGAGLLVAGDFVSLNADLSVEKGYLHDAVAAANHGLHEQAEQALLLLRTPADAGVWLTHMRALGLEPVQSAEIISFLNSIGGLRLARPAAVKLAVTARHAAVVIRGAAPVFWARRLPLTTAGVALGSTLALVPVLAAAVVTAFLLYGAGLRPAGVATVTCVAGSSLWLSIFAHELAHARILARSGARGAVLQQGMHLGIIHGPLTARVGISCALAGPLVGSAVAIIFLGMAAGFTGRRVFLGLALLTIGLHLMSFLPSSADGRTLRQFWISREQA